MIKFRKEKLKSFVVALSCLLSVATATMVGVSMSNATKTSATVHSIEYTRGNVDAKGKRIESKKSIVMKDTRNVDGLTIDIDEENAIITYCVVFYDEDGAYISKTANMATDYDAASTPSSAETYRIVITPSVKKKKTTKEKASNAGLFFLSCEKLDI